MPYENVLGEEGRGVRVLMSGLDYERVVLAGGPLGIMAACTDGAMPYVRERRQFDQPLGEFRLVQGKVADMYSTMNACRAYVYAVAAACDRGETTRKAGRQSPESLATPSRPSRRSSRYWCRRAIWAFEFTIHKKSLETSGGRDR